MTAHVSDADTGVNHVDFLAMDAYTSKKLCSGSMVLTSGDYKDGTWSFGCVVPADAEYSTYSAQVHAYDNQNNQGYSTSGFNVVY